MRQYEKERQSQIKMPAEMICAPEGKSLDLTHVISELRNELTNIDHAIRALERISAGETVEVSLRVKHGARRKARIETAGGDGLSAGANSA